ncbi:hypothetical protein AMTR_s00005p00262510 [Amborella trichopoda]|uniref:Uncharacterized protein n=1 Tax=Amborella trichopoda TaxID=13333 RepID=W1PGU3_AMBTC|nr:hypothetical protein AMTR_s00005p00262510 [Amborella trichopoda]
MICPSNNDDAASTSSAYISDRQVCGAAIMRKAGVSYGNGQRALFTHQSAHGRGSTEAALVIESKRTQSSPSSVARAKAQPGEVEVVAFQ